MYSTDHMAPCSSFTYTVCKLSRIAKPPLLHCWVFINMKNLHVVVFDIFCLLNNLLIIWKKYWNSFELLPLSANIQNTYFYPQNLLFIQFYHFNSQDALIDDTENRKTWKNILYYVHVASIASQSMRWLNYLPFI